MRNKRAVSDDEDEAPAEPLSSSNSDEEHRRSKRKRKQIKLLYEDEGEEEKKLVEESANKEWNHDQASGSANGGDHNEIEDDTAVAKPIGEAVRSSGEGRKRCNHFQAFEYDGCRYHLEDSVLLVPEEHNGMPHVAIIKDITQSKNGAMMVQVQRFYRPEEAENAGGAKFNSFDTRELFYSFHRDEVSADLVMHKCVVHFIALDMQIPERKDHPGFIVLEVYDTERRLLFNLTNNYYEDSKQHEIDLLIQKTMAWLGHIPDIET